MNKNKLNHVAFILDGNKRWAEKNNKASINGYKKGFDKIIEIVDYSIKIQLSDLTLFTLSSENINRSSVNIIYEIIYNNFASLLDQIIKKNNIKINIIGNRKNLPEKIIKIFNDAESATSDNKNLCLNLAFNYGFKEEIKDVLRKFKNNVDAINIENNEHVKKLFYLSNKIDPDILIRTGGYKRLSNFIMYNLTYTELFFTETLWPEFKVEEFQNILENFFKINRKYGL